MKTKKNRGAVAVIVVIALILAVLLVGIYLVGAGYVSAAFETVAKWGEEGIPEGVSIFIQEKLPPILIALGASIGTVLAALLPVIAKVKKAAEQMDLGTRESVKSTELTAAARQEMQENNVSLNERLERHNEAMTARMEAFMTEQREVLAEFMGQLTEDTLSERNKTSRIENAVVRLLRIETLAHGAEEELVKKGVASEIARVADEDKEV